MTSTPRNEPEESLNESWVEVPGGQQPGELPQLGGSASSMVYRPLNISNTNMEKLLMEAQRESRSNSRGSSQGGSPKSPNSPVLSSGPSAPGSTYSGSSSERPQVPGDMGMLNRAEWMDCWASRPEPQPPKEFRFKQLPEHTRLSIRKSKAMKSSLLSSENWTYVIPSLLITNIFALGLGIMIGMRISSPHTS
ncbi:BCL2/adenovirus E1B 19 kDa protein-interacting protein 3-like [Amphiura filiformis]|uniref:BCL2/adenovirus E1B 19 kDa protein-interacting protein 3-like n=1 Tax=Amphiura filiformis TaxID=82378 RepID=UPI003B22413C